MTAVPASSACPSTFFFKDVAKVRNKFDFKVLDRLAGAAHTTANALFEQAKLLILITLHDLYNLPHDIVQGVCHLSFQFL